jgi:O-antigen/teichoic acid export membrane protein
MTGWLKSLVKDSMVYGIGFGFSRFLQVIVLPIITHTLTVAEYGYYSNYVIFYTIAGGCFILGLDNSVARFYYDSDDETYHKKIFSTALFTVVAISLLSLVLFSSLSELMMPVIGVPHTYKSALFYVLLTIPALVLNNFFLSWFKWKRQKFYFLINSIGTVLFLLMPLLLIRNLDFVTLFQVIFYSQMTIAIVSIALARNYLTLHFSTPLLVSMLKYGFPWMLVFILGVSRSYLDRFFLTRYLNDNSYGIYNFSVRISTFLALIITAFDMSFGPLSFSIWNKPDAPRFFARLQSAYTFLISVAACGLAIISPFLVELLGGQQYSGAEKVLPILLFSAIPLSLINFSSLGTSYAKKSFLSTTTLLVGFMAVLILNFVLTPVFFEFGAVTASLLGHLLILATGYFFSKRYYSISFHFRKDSMIFLLFLALAVGAVYVRTSAHLVQDIMIKLLLLLATTLLVFLVFFKTEYQKSLLYLKNLRYARFGSNASL